MVASVGIQSPADAINLGLAKIGYKLRLGSLFDGSAAAKKALDVYVQTRDQLLRQNDWYFAERNATLTPVKTAPAGGYFPPTTWSTAYPPIGWNYEALYPTDCLKIRAVKPVPLFQPNFDPQPNLFAEANDNALNPPARVILYNVPNAVLVYTGQVTDPTNWDVDFCETFVDQLAIRLAPSFNPDMLKLLVPESGQSQAVAEMEQG